MSVLKGPGLVARELLGCYQTMQGKRYGSLNATVVIRMKRSFWDIFCAKIDRIERLTGLGVRVREKVRSWWAFRPPAFLTDWVVVLFIYMKTMGWRAGVRRLSSALQLTSLLPAFHPNLSPLSFNITLWCHDLDLHLIFYLYIPFFSTRLCTPWQQSL